MIDVSSDNYADLAHVTSTIRDHMDNMPKLRDVEDTRPLPGIEWDLAINRELASRFGVNAQSIGTAVQLVTNGILVGKYRPDDAHDEVDIRVRYPKQFRGIHALDGLRVATANGSMVPISNFVTMKPAQQVNSIERVDGHRVYHVRANVKPGVNANAEIAKIKTWIGTQTFPQRRAGVVQGRRGAAGRIRRIPDRGGVPGAVPDRDRAAGPVQQLLSRHADPDRRGAGHDRLAAGHGGDGPALLDHHDRHRHAGAGRHRREPQHRPDRHLPSPARCGHGPDRGGDPLQRAAPAARCS